MAALAVRLIAVPALLLLPSCKSEYAKPRERDVWYAVIADGQRFGYRHTLIEQLPTGNYSYTVTERHFASFLGKTEQDAATYVRWVVTPRYQPLSVKRVRWYGAEESQASARVQNGRLLITTVDAAGKRAISLELDDDAIPHVCLEDWLPEQSADADSLTVRLIQEELWNIQPVTATREGHDVSGSTWRLQATGQPALTYVFDGDKTLSEIQFEYPEMVVRRCSAEEAQDVEYRYFDERVALRFPLDKRISAPDRLTELTVTLTWKDIPIDRFRFEDCRQHVLEQSVQDGRYRVTLKTESPPLLTSDVPLPIDDPDLAPYLAESPWIKPKDKQIAAAARNVVAELHTALEAVEALCSWVDKHVASTESPQSPLAPKVLADKRGGCVHHATLFASLARAVGIPTRIASGERISDGMWAPHVWNEAYVGRWIPVDVGFNEVGGSAALLKVCHSDSAAGIQRLYWDLAENLAISIQDFRLRPSPLAEKYRTGVEGNTYTNVECACRLTAPDSEWTIKEASGDDISGVSFYKLGKEGGLSMDLLTFAECTMAPSDLAELYLWAQERTVGEAEVVEKGTCQVGGTEACKIRLRCAPTQDDPGPRLVTTVAWRHNSFGYLASLTTSESEHEGYLPSFEKLLASFEFLKDE